MLEHHRGDPLGAAELDPAGQLGGVDVQLEQSERGLGLARAGGGEPALQRGQAGRGGVAALLDQGHRGARGEPGGQPHHVRARGLAHGQQHPGDRRRSGGVRRERADQQVGPVAGGDHHGALGERAEEVGQHRPAEDEGAHVAGQPGGVAEQHLGAGGLHHLGDRGRGQRGFVGDHVDRDVGPGGQPPLHLLLVPSGHPVGDHGQHAAAQVGVGAVGVADLGDDGVRALPVAADDRQHPGPELVGEPGVHRQLVRDVGVGEVGAEHQDRLAAPLQLVEAVHQLADQLLRALLGLERGGLLVGQPVQLPGRQVEPVAAAQQLHHVVGPVMGERSEHPDPVHLPGEQFHHAELDGLAPVAPADPGHVHAARHRAPRSLPGHW